MKKFELFIVIYEFLKSYKEKNKTEELFNHFLYDANPYVWKECISADPALYKEFEQYIGKKTISLDNSFDIAKEYIYSLEDEYYDLAEMKKAFNSISKDEWMNLCTDLMSKPLKKDI